MIHNCNTNPELLEDSHPAGSAPHGLIFPKAHIYLRLNLHSEPAQLLTTLGSQADNKQEDKVLRSRGKAFRAMGIIVVVVCVWRKNETKILSDEVTVVQIVAIPGSYIHPLSPGLLVYQKKIYMQQLVNSKATIKTV